MVTRSRLSSRKTVISADDLVSEADIEKTCTEFLALDGWYALTTDPKQLRGLGVTEPGMPDRQYRRFVVQYLSAMMWIEWKRVACREGHENKHRSRTPGTSGKESAAF